MQIFPETPQFDFMGKRGAFFAASGLLAAVCAALLAVRGINYGIDFTGGSVVHVTFEQSVDLKEVRALLSKAGYASAIPQRFTGTDSYSIRIKEAGEASSEAADAFLDALRKAAADRPFRVDEKEFVGPTVGRHLYKQALFAVVFSMVGIVGYVAVRFSNPLWGFAGILALAHDVLAVLGIFAVLQLELDLVLVAAVLTVAGYSINDSIVIFDRMRERLRTMRRESKAEIFNTSINETLSRTLITSLTTFVTCLALLLVGGPVIRDFAITLCAGILVGTYSSIGVAASLVYQWEGTGTSKPAAGGARGGNGGGSRRAERRRGAKEELEDKLGEAYGLLDVKADASFDEVKEAFKRKMAESAPEKVAHLSPKLRQAAADETKELQRAYEAIRKARGEG